MTNVRLDRFAIVPLRLRSTAVEGVSARPSLAISRRDVLALHAPYRPPY